MHCTEQYDDATVIILLRTEYINTKAFNCEFQI